MGRSSASSWDWRKCHAVLKDSYLLWTGFTLIAIKSVINFPYVSVIWFVRSVEVLERWAKDLVLLNMLERQQLYLGHTLPLGTYLCKPVQRILKYHLLLKARQTILTPNPYFAAVSFSSSESAGICFYRRRFVCLSVCLWPR